MLTAVDGSVVKTLASLAEAAYLRDSNGQAHCGWRFHTHFEIDRQLPVRIEVTSALNGGKTDEKHVLRRSLQPDRCYVMDRWYAEFALWNDIVAAGSSYVCRIRDNSNLDEVIEERPVSEAARRAGVLRDIVVKLGTSHKAEARPNHPVRVILVKAEPHRKRGGRPGQAAGPPSDGILRIATDLLDVPAEIIADIYKHRWSIELFFRFFKHVLGCRHLLSTHPVGHPDPGLLCDHRLPADPPLDRRQADAADLRDDLPVPAGLGHPGGADGAPGEAQDQVEGPTCPWLLNYDQMILYLETEIVKKRMKTARRAFSPVVRFDASPRMLRESTRRPGSEPVIRSYDSPGGAATKLAVPDANDEPNRCGMSAFLSPALRLQSEEPLFCGGDFSRVMILQVLSCVRGFFGVETYKKGNLVIIHRAG